MTYVYPVLRMIVGDVFERTLAARAQQMLLKASALTGTGAGPRAIRIHAADAMGIAAVRILAARGFLTQNLDGDPSADTYGCFSITEDGAEAAKRHT